MIKKRCFFWLTLLFGIPSAVFAWGNKGHRVVAQIARNQVAREIVDSVNFYLNGTQWEDAAIWMNEVKKSGAYDYMLPWHGITIARDKTYVKSDYPNVINRIEYCVKILKSRALYPRNEVMTALMVLFHLVGDLHQPLNCGYPDDRGGRRVEVEYLGRKTSLYKLWESEIIETEDVDQWEGAKVTLTMTKADIAEIKYGNVTDWLDESREVLKYVYDFKNNYIGQEYTLKNKKIIARQFVKAGMRLAYILNSCFRISSRCTF